MSAISECGVKTRGAGRAWAVLAMVAGLAATEASAQAAARGAVGVQGGYSRAQFRGAEADAFGAREAAYVSIYARRWFGGYFSFQPEAVFTLKGGEADLVIEGQPVSFGLELAYIEAPLLLRVALPWRSTRISPILFAGPAAAIQIGCSLQASVGDERTSVPCDDVDPDAPGEQDLRLREFEASVVIGGGVEFRWTGAALGIEARLTRGLTEVFSDVDDFKNESYAILFALSF